MGTRANLRGPDGSALRHPASASSRLTRTIGRGARSAAIIATCLALLVGCSSLSSVGGGVAVGYTFPLLPIEITVTGSGTIVVSVVGEIATPLGTFSVGVPLASWTIHPGEILLAIWHHISGLLAQGGPVGGDAELVRHDQAGAGAAAAGGGWVQDIIMIKKPAPSMGHRANGMRFLVDGPAGLEPEAGDRAILRLGAGVTGIRIRPTTQSGFSKRTRSPLPTPSGMTAPSSTLTSFPAPTAKCAPLKRPGTVTCAATVAGGTGSLTYQWFDCHPPSGCGTPIGASNPLIAALKPGVHLITVTVADGNGNSATSAAVTVKIPVGLVSTTTSAPSWPAPALLLGPSQPMAR